MQKEFKALDEQIELLKKRGLSIPDERRAKRYLLTNNYYSIINGYGKYFQDRPDHYLSGASFDEVINLYFFEEEIKKAVFNAILQIEHHVKSVVAYRFAEQHPNQNYAFLDPKSYNQQEQKLLLAYNTISKFSLILKKSANSPNSSIHHYVSKYKGIPIWVLMDYLDFGSLYYFTRVLPDNVLNKVAADLVPFINENIPGTYPAVEFTPEIMLKFLKNIHETRNICAHNNRLLDFKCRSDSPYYGPLHKKYDISRKDHRTSFYSTFISMQCFLSKTEFAVLNNSLRRKFLSLNKHMNTISINEVLAKMGFPKDWQLQPSLDQ
ncbi:Abi family protein [Lactobacillus delbrueckii]|uniref:Abi family protein n=1 Tax=Lactobacillus delbrueckii TaxID=1584 RepID=UPI0022EBC97D|nr:Abi family protein [Lactobacillus delbrueckii]MDA3849383.1 Abi family protein [Lactobacillus delbrueckii]